MPGNVDARQAAALLRGLANSFEGKPNDLNQLTQVIPGGPGDPSTIDPQQYLNYLQQAVTAVRGNPQGRQAADNLRPPHGGHLKIEFEWYEVAIIAAMILL
jgi:hypothetical protein